MTPKEKAEELVKKYHKDILNTNYFGYKKAKQCALIAVEDKKVEVMELFFKMREMGATQKMLKIINDKHHYWQEVKNEIDKL